MFGRTRPAASDVMRGVILIALACLLGLWQGSRGAHAHDEHDWIREGGYRSPVTSEWCCGKRDCVVVPSAEVEPAERGWHIDRTDETIPYRETLPSQDGRFWRCHRPDGARRCFFAPPGVS